MKDFEEIWHKYYPGLTVYLRTSFHFNDTDDLVQEIMFKIHRSLPRRDRSRNLKTWIYTIARNHAVDALRKQSARLRLVEAAVNEAAASASPFPGPETELLNSELTEDIGTFIGCLPEAERQTAFFRFHEQLSIREISRITDAPAGTVKYRIHSIKKKLAAYYGENYED